MILAIFHAGGQTRDKKMETICKENTNTVDISFQPKYTSIYLFLESKIVWFRTLIDIQ